MTPGWMPFIIAMASMDQHGIYALARPTVRMRMTVVGVVRMIMIAVIVMMMVGGSMR